MVADIVYRLAEPDDGPQLAQLRWAFHVEDHDDASVEPLEAFSARFDGFWREAMTAGRWVVWVADRGGRLLANVWVFRVGKVPRPVPAPKHMGYITNTYTVPDARDRGIGRELLDALQAWAEREGMELLFVWPSARSVPFYRRAGFSVGSEMMELHLPPASG